ncbi:MAG: hypothetical protein E7379_02570 [Clostridiales bacterium]|nr:hypothetical protein [Clostridiales bacterium]
MALNYRNNGNGNTIIPKLVKKDNKYYYMDIDGSISDGFVNATVYAGGFSLVKTTSNKTSFQFRDMLGNLSLKKTQVGKDFYEFWRQNLAFEALKPEYFVNDKFYNVVKMIMVERAKPLAHYQIQRCDEKRELGIKLLIAATENNK